jgi:HD-GYP domain-containing protein (c-di-GMP phosphodiesterase class II)
VAGTVAAALACSAAVAYIIPPTHAPIKYLIFLCVMGAIAEVLLLFLPSGAGSSIAGVQFQSAALIAPDWTALAVVAIAETIGQLIHRRGWLKATFNVAQLTLATAVGILSYHVLGGRSLLHGDMESLAQATWETGLPAVVLITVFFVVNTFAVSGAIAASEERRLVQVWRSGHLSTLAYEILSSPFVFFFAWATVRLGPLGAVLLALPALGLRQLYKTKLDLERSHQDMLELMVKAIEARDPYTSGHSRRVQRYSMVIARALNLGAREVQRIGTAALLHDVGKIHERYAPLLRKPGELTEDEWRVMEQHPVDGAALVATAGHLRDLVLPIRHHHERWDGKGYPDGLRGEAIPLASRIIMFADTIDAMTTARPYRGPLGEQEVRSEFVRCRGKQFDPNICDALLSSPLWHTLFTPSIDTERHFGTEPRLGVVAKTRKLMGVG